MESENHLPANPGDNPRFTPWKRLRLHRFEGRTELQFRASFERLGRASRSYLWRIILLSMTFMVGFHALFLDLPTSVIPLVHLAIFAVIIPALLRG